jgi:hypothetical protein
MKNDPLFLVLALSGLAVSGAGGCGGASRDGGASPPSATPTNRPNAATPTPGDPTLITGSGTVHHLDLEGGFYGIVADDSARYDPGELDPRFRRGGLRVRFDLRRVEGAMSIRQWGTIVTVVRIDSL